MVAQGGPHAVDGSTGVPRGVELTPRSAGLSGAVLQEVQGPVRTGRGLYGAGYVRGCSGAATCHGHTAAGPAPAAATPGRAPPSPAAGPPSTRAAGGVCPPPYRAAWAGEATRLQSGAEGNRHSHNELRFSQREDHFRPVEKGSLTTRIRKPSPNTHVWRCAG